MPIVLQRGSIDKPLTFNIGLLQLIVQTSVILNNLYTSMCIIMKVAESLAGRNSFICNYT